MSNIENEYYKSLFTKITTLDEIRKYMPSYIEILEFSGILKFKEYCESNNLDLGYFKYAYVSIKDMFDKEKKYYIVHNINTNTYLFCTGWENLITKVYCDIVCKCHDCTFIKSQVPFNIEKYKSDLLEKAIDILKNEFDLDDLRDFINDNT